MMFLLGLGSEVWRKTGARALYRGEKDLMKMNRQGKGA
jgi:hypothetical protein